jgi:hypothetical protein
VRRKTQSKTTMIQPDKRSINTGATTTTSTVIPPIIPEANISSTKKPKTKKEDTNIPAESLVTNSLQQKNDVVINENEKENEIASVEKKAVMLPNATEEKQRRQNLQNLKPVLLTSIDWLMYKQIIINNGLLEV